MWDIIIEPPQAAAEEQEQSGEERVGVGGIVDCVDQRDGYNEVVWPESQYCGGGFAA